MITTEAIASNTTLKRCTGKDNTANQRSIRSGCSTCGKRDGLYWAHIDGTHAGLNSQHCDRCGTTVSLVFVEGPADSSTITCVHPHLPRVAGDGNGHHSRPSYSPRPYANTAPVPSAPVPVSADATEAAAQLVALLQRPTVTLDQVRELVREANDGHVKSILDSVSELVSERMADISMPLSLRVESADQVIRDLSNVHNVLPKVIKAAAKRKHVMMVGPMGTGKSTIASQAAESLGLEFRFKAVGPQTSESSILGYMTADGTYVPTLFRQAYEHGGVFLFDELDAAHPGVLTIINSALANGHMAFPDGMVKRHDDCIIMAAANTYGRGPDRMYVGRQAIDAATLDRFIVIEVLVDEALEATLAHATGLDGDRSHKVIQYVRSLRRAAEAHKMAVGFSPRATVNACDMLAAGWSWSDVSDSCIRKGLSDQDWSKVTSGIYAPTV